MVKKEGMFAKRFGVLFALLLLGMFTAQGLLALGVFGSDKHIKNGMNCEDCHGTAKVAEGAKVSQAKCQSCHGSYEKLAKLTEKMKLNPHVDYHLGELDCNVCHHGHRADENHCSKCHKE